jgi:D-tyrosyl-tRNA(Tyr) deacylase
MSLAYWPPNGAHVGGGDGHYASQFTKSLIEQSAYSSWGISNYTGKNLTISLCMQSITPPSGRHVPKYASVTSIICYLP